MSAKPKTKADSLIAAIQRKAPTSTPEPEPEAVAPPPQEPHRKAAARDTHNPVPKNRVGKPAQYWFHDEDRRLVRELAAWLAGQGERPTDSMVLRAALRTVKTGSGFLEAYRQAAQLDGRLKQHKTA